MEYPQTVGELTEKLRQGGYLADRGLATSVLVSLSLHRPVLLEGEVGVGKTELAKVLAAVFGRRLIRLQCYEGIDTNQALYEWDYARQMLQIRALSEREAAGEEAVDQLFGPKFLLERPLLAAIRAGDQAVLLIDEIDRADDEFEAFLLEVLSDFQISIPEIGTIEAAAPPAVILTSNRTRELHDALRRRCLYHWIGYPTAERELEIVLTREPSAATALARKVVTAVHRLRELDLAKPPGVAETIDWVAHARVPRRERPQRGCRVRHHRRGHQGQGRPRPGARPARGDHFRRLTSAGPACLRQSPGRLRPRAPGRGRVRGYRRCGDVLLGRGACSIPPTWSICTGPAGPRSSARRMTLPSTTRRSGRTSWPRTRPRAICSS